MGNLSYTESKKIANRTILILGIITIVEVFIALAGKGYVFEGIEIQGIYIGLIMIVLSLIKAYLIIYEFMHMKYEVPALVKTVLIPTVLLIWGAIAFAWEGEEWKNNRNSLNNIEVVTETPGDVIEDSYDSK